MPYLRNFYGIAENLEILVVDDDPIIRLLHQNTLKTFNLPYPVKSFKNGKEAMTHLNLRRNSNTTFLVLLDIHMPVMNGWEFLQECQKDSFGNKMYTIMLTSSTAQEDRKKAGEYSQVIKYLEKPFKKENFQELSNLDTLHLFFSLKEPDSKIPAKGYACPSDLGFCW